jgi:protein-disulfide isomerase
LTPQNNQAALAAIEHEAQTANIQFVPTIILGQHIFDESIDLTELEQLISQ